MTLKEVFEALNVTAYDLTVDMLDVHAVRENKYFYVLSNVKEVQGVGINYQVKTMSLLDNIACTLQMRHFVCKPC